MLEDAIAVVGASLATSACLPALPHMLRRGRLREHYGEAICKSLLPIADEMDVIVGDGREQEEELAAVHEIDPGEAQIFAVGAVSPDIVIITSDKRALKAVARFEELSSLLSGRIAPLEVVLLALCDKMGLDMMRRRVVPLLEWDRAIEVCFSPEVSDPQAALRSYLDDLANKIRPLVLWEPNPGETS